MNDLSVLEQYEQDLESWYLDPTDRTFYEWREERDRVREMLRQQPQFNVIGAAYFASLGPPPPLYPPPLPGIGGILSGVLGGFGGLLGRRP